MYRHREHINVSHAFASQRVGTEEVDQRRERWWQRVLERLLAYDFSSKQMHNLAPIGSV